MENYETTREQPPPLCCSEAINAACERRGIDISRIEVFDGFSSPLPILTTDTSSLGGKHLRITGKIYYSRIRILHSFYIHFLYSLKRLDIKTVRKRTFRGIREFVLILVEIGIVGFLDSLLLLSQKSFNVGNWTSKGRRRYYQKYDIYISISICSCRQRYKGFGETKRRTWLAREWPIR